MNFHKTLIRDTIIIAFVIKCIGILKMQMVDADAVNNVEYSNTCFVRYEHENHDIIAIDNNNRILCNKIFDIYQFKICLNIPGEYYIANPSYYTRTQTFFNMLDHVNYTKYKYCSFGSRINGCDEYILTINKLDPNYLNSFWLISN